MYGLVAASVGTSVGFLNLYIFLFFIFYIEQIYNVKALIFSIMTTYKWTLIVQMQEFRV